MRMLLWRALRDVIRCQRYRMALETIAKVQTLHAEQIAQVALTGRAARIDF